MSSHFQEWREDYFTNIAGNTEQHIDETLRITPSSQEKTNPLNKHPEAPSLTCCKARHLETFKKEQILIH